MIKEIIERVWSFLKFIFDDPDNDEDWWSKFEHVVFSAIGMVETTAQEHETESYVKKQKAIELVLQMLAAIGLKLPVAMWLQKLIIGIAIDALVTYLNEKFGHDWLEKVPDLT